MTTLRRCCILALFILGLYNPCYANEDFTKRPDVARFIQLMVKKHQFNQKLLLSLFAQVKTRPQVLKSLNQPLEKENWQTYQLLFVNQWRIKHGVEFWHKHAKTLQNVEKKYGVPASIIVATLGIETKYGQRMGGYKVLDALANIAFSDSPRANYFRKELEEFLLLSRELHMDPLKIMGSYAGAMGQPQFMPSSYRYYAVNFKHQGAPDLINNVEDAIISVANYYKKHGWETNSPITSQTFANDKYKAYLMRHAMLKSTLGLRYLIHLGIAKDSKAHAKDTAKVILLPGRYHHEYWLGFHNFEVIKRYNASDLYAMAVFQLSTYIANLRERLHDN